LDLSTRTWRVLLTDASFPVYVPTGHLLVTSEKGLAVVRFDPIAVEIHGTPQPLIDDVFFKNTTGAADVSVSATGTLAYVSGRLSDSTTLIWTDRQGNASQVPVPPASFIALRLSPDGRRVALTQNDKGAPGIWVYDFERQTLMRVTPSGFPGFFPLWSESGRDIYFSGAPATETGIYSMPASGAGVPTLVAAAPPGSRLVPSSVRPGSTEVVFEQWSGTGVRTIMVVKPGATPTVTPLFPDVARYALPAISPDGRWIAYSSDEGGRQELYLRPFPDVAADRIQVSTDGGRAPVWAKGGKELFYSSLDGAIWAASVGDPRSRDVGKPVRIPDPPAMGLRTPFDVAPDGQRVLRMVLEAPKETTNELRVVTNWFEVLKKKS
jgi:serine/threonine-protein kinase